MTQVIKTNDTGIDLKAAGLPPPPTPGEGKGEMPQAPAEVEDMEPEVAAQDSDAELRRQVIAGEDPAARRELMARIHRYYSDSRFGSFLKKRGFAEEDLSCKTMDEMQKLLGDIQFNVANKNSSSMIETAVPHLICAAEPLISTVFDIRGVSNVLSKDEVFLDTLREYALENSIFTHASPGKRLVFQVLKSCVTVNAFRAHRKAEEEAKAAVADKDVRVSAATLDLMK